MKCKRFNPALGARVPAQANLYLPFYVKAFGKDVSFWHRPPTQAYAAALNDFLRLDSGIETMARGELRADPP